MGVRCRRALPVLIVLLGLLGTSAAPAVTVQAVKIRHQGGGVIDPQAVLSFTGVKAGASDHLS